MPAYSSAPQNLSPDKHVDVCADGEEDRGSTPLASSPEGFRGYRAGALAEADVMGFKDTFVRATARQGSQKKCIASHTFTFCKATLIQGVFIPAAQMIYAIDWSDTMTVEVSIRQSGSLGASRPISPSRIPDAPPISNVTASPLPDAPS
jgi:hypothetical protein